MFSHSDYEEEEGVYDSDGAADDDGGHIDDDDYDDDDVKVDGCERTARVCCLPFDGSTPPGFKEKLQNHTNTNTNSGPTVVQHQHQSTTKSSHCHHENCPILSTPLFMGRGKPHFD